MDIDQVFDFDATLEVNVPGATIPPHPNCDLEIQQLEKASSEGGLPTVQRIFDSLRGSPAGEFWLKGPGSSLLFAVQDRRNTTVEYLLSQGVLLDINHVGAAIRNKDKAMLELFLKHGWDINERTEWAVPPPLALVTTNNVI